METLRRDFEALSSALQCPAEPPRVLEKLEQERVERDTAIATLRQDLESLASTWQCNRQESHQIDESRVLTLIERERPKIIEELKRERTERDAAIQALRSDIESRSLVSPRSQQAPEQPQLDENRVFALIDQQRERFELSAAMDRLRGDVLSMCSSAQRMPGSAQLDETRVLSLIEQERHVVIRDLERERIERSTSMDALRRDFETFCTSMKSLPGHSQSDEGRVLPLIEQEREKVLEGLERERMERCASIEALRLDLDSVSATLKPVQLDEGRILSIIEKNSERIAQDLERERAERGVAMEALQQRFQTFSTMHVDKSHVSAEVLVVRKDLERDRVETSDAIEVLRQDIESLSSSQLDESRLLDLFAQERRERDDSLKTLRCEVDMRLDQFEETVRCRNGEEAWTGQVQKLMADVRGDLDAATQHLEEQLEVSIETLRSDIASSAQVVQLQMARADKTANDLHQDMCSRLEGLRAVIQKEASASMETLELHVQKELTQSKLELGEYAEALATTQQKLALADRASDEFHKTFAQHRAEIAAAQAASESQVKGVLLDLSCKLEELQTGMQTEMAASMVTLESRLNDELAKSRFEPEKLAEALANTQEYLADTQHRVQDFASMVGDRLGRLESNLAAERSTTSSTDTPVRASRGLARSTTSSTDTPNNPADNFQKVEENAGKLKNRASPKTPEKTPAAPQNVPEKSVGGWESRLQEFAASMPTIDVPSVTCWARPTGSSQLQPAASPQQAEAARLIMQMIHEDPQVRERWQRAHGSTHSTFLPLSSLSAFLSSSNVEQQ
eukprot:gnl/TRDRNA2_/TRDRNA2_174778_c2_seq3.p1 gnl/TRDRNA2_/TRDRNA2_174778_c2~~gnl/TRDRNA2_/TRDRNA2_174778_c2_seq3.p1  ORF type:complete len:866 (-),score=170.99 gnl/TRDRNA2_/TRDRNA2_174778_c2_seq3:119-2509(-)